MRAARAACGNDAAVYMNVINLCHGVDWRKHECAEMIATKLSNGFVSPVWVLFKAIYQLHGTAAEMN